jgi:hypothetical protein
VRFIVPNIVILVNDGFDVELFELIKVEGMDGCVRID